MKKILSLLSFALFILVQVSAQTTISGNVTASDHSQTIIFANVELSQNNKAINAVNTDVNGFYFIHGVSTGTYKLRFSFVGYKTIESEIKILPGMDSLIVNASLDSEILLEEVVTESDAQAEDIAITTAPRPISTEVAKQSSGINRSYDKRERKAHYKKDAYHRPAPVIQNSEEYGKFSENQFISPLDEGYSTFSIDVDRASYSVVRRFLNQNSLPPVDAVRIEELINYFHYDYPSPLSKEAFDVDSEYSSCPWNEKLGLLRVGIQGKEFQPENSKGTNLVFLLDVSGSMNSENKLPLLKRSFRLLLDNLNPEDKVSIAVYAGAAGTILEPTSVKEKSKILAALNNLSAGGSTAGAAGIELAYQLAEENFIKGGNNRVILATDGDFNVGIHDVEELDKFITTKKDKGIYLTVLGFGMGNYKDNRLETLADKGNGNYAYIDNIREAQKVFGHELTGTLFTIAKDVKIQIEFNPAYVQAYRLIGYENRLLAKEDFNNDKKDAGELGAGHQVTALYEIVPVGVNNKWVGSVDPMKYQQKKDKVNLIKNGEMCTLKLRYKQPDATKSTYSDFKVSAAQAKWNEASENLQLAAGIAAWGMKLRNSDFSRDLSYADIHEICKNARGEDPHGYRTELLQLIKSSELLEKTQGSSAYGNAD